MNGKLAKRIRRAAERSWGTENPVSTSILKREYRELPYHKRAGLPMSGHSAMLRRIHTYEGHLGRGRV